MILVAIPLFALMFYKPTGIKLVREDAPKLFEMIDDISAKLKVKTPKVILTYDSGIAVTGVFSKRLLIGMAGILKMRKDELYAILVHEMAHLKGLDSFVGAWLSSVNIAIGSVLKLFEKIPVWHWIMTVIYYGLVAYLYVYNFFNLGYSRQREYLADRYAAQLAGKNTFSEALVNYVIYTAYFEQGAINAVVNAGLKGRKFANLYSLYSKHALGKRTKNKKQLRKDVLAAKRSWFDSHPSIANRVNAIKDLPNRSVPYKGLALALLKNPKRMQKELTEMLTARVLSKAKVYKEGGQTYVQVPSLN